MFYAFATEPMATIFISHSWKDKAFVGELAKRLEGWGHEAWVDEKEIKAGQPVQQKIAEEIAYCDVVLFFLSPDAVDSGWVHDELNFAQEKGKPLFPLLLEDCGEKHPPALKEIKHANFCRGRSEIGWKEVEEGLTALSASKPRRATRSSLPVMAALVLVAGGMGLTLARKGTSSRSIEPPGAPRKSLLLQLVEAIRGSTSSGSSELPSALPIGSPVNSYPRGMVGSANSLADIRAQDQVRPLQDNEVNLTVDRLPMGSFGFVESSSLHSLRRARTVPAESTTSFEVHKTSTGQILIVGYTSEAASVGATRNQPVNLSLAHQKVAWANRAISIPVDRLKGVSLRIEQGQEVADLSLGAAPSGP